MDPSALAAMRAATRYEFSMQVRRPSVWILMLLLSLMIFMGVGPNHPMNLPATTPTAVLIASWAFVNNILAPIGVGILLADRLPRDRTLRVEELLTSLPAPRGSRLAGKYVGATMATALPVLLVYAVEVGQVLADTGDPAAIPLAVAAFAVINLPAILFVGAFSIACPAVLWVPLYQFLFVGSWFWQMMSPAAGVPTVSGTLLSPVGDWVTAGIFGARGLWVRSASAWQGVANLLVLTAASALALWAADRYLAWRQARL